MDKNMDYSTLTACRVGEKPYLCQRKNTNNMAKDGFVGERSVVLPPAIVEMEEHDPLVSSLFITDIGYYPCAEHHFRVRDEPINQFVLIYCVDGKGWYRLRGKTFEVSSNQFFILPAGEPHAYGAAKESSWTIYWVHFRGQHSAIFSEGAQVPQTINVAINSRINDRNNIFEEILTTLLHHRDLEDLRYASSLLHHYLASMRYLTQFRKATGTENHDLVEAAIHYMHENIERRITMNDLTRYTGYSASHFSTLFRRRKGCSPLNYFNRLRVEHACRLLRETDMKIHQISFKVGIEDSLYFSRLFSKVMGMSPREYRMGKVDNPLPQDDKPE